ncbi:MAG: hypothetical protein DHS20C14_09100 [Phycisphaeraceae bacterium]|nr:MAG: hypothetical protein DHS20C14_09100 [Phycisphaeraceae bacterium]
MTTPVRTRLAVLAAIGALNAAAIAQPDLVGGDVNPTVVERLAAPYLSDDERAELRLFHGMWTADDLRTPADNARAALVLGRYDHPALRDAEADVSDRAEAALKRGEPERTLELLTQSRTIRGARLQAEALFMLGRHDEAVEAVQPVVEAFSARRVESAADIAEGVRALMVRARVLGSELGDGGDYKAMLALLAHARDDLDRLDWRPRLAEAVLLYERHNRAEANAALSEVLALNPRCAEALAMRGRLAVDGFNFDAMNAIVFELDRLASSATLIEGGAPIGSAEARLIEAHAWLRQRNAIETRLTLSPVLTRHPDHREALALDAAASAVGARFGDAQTTLDRLEQLSPGSPIGPLTVGRALAEARQYDLAPAYLERAADRLPNDSTAPMELGLMELQAGRDADAIGHLTHATTLDPFNARANNSLTLALEVTTYARVETPHFIVRHAPGIDAVFAADMPGPLEALYARVTGDAPGGIDHEPAHKTFIDVLPDHQHFAVRITGMPELWTIAASTGPIIAMEAPRPGPNKKTGPYDWARVLQHEFTHTVTLSRSNNRIPHWMTEGMSVYLEDRPRDERTWRLLAQAYSQNRLFDLRDINIAFVRPKQPADRSLAYAQGEWLIEYVNERFGPEAPREILDEVGKGASDMQAFEAVLEEPVEDFLAAFRAWAREDLIRVGMRVPEGVPTYEQLCARDGVSPSEAAGDASHLDAWLDEFADHPEVLEARVGLAIAGAGRVPDASVVPELERLARVIPVASTPHRLLSRVFLSSDDPEDHARAIPHLAFLDEREQSTPAFAAELSRLYEQAGDTAAAHRYAERVVMIAPYDADGRERAARTAILAGELLDARRHLAALVALEPDRARHQQRLDAMDAMIERAAGG